MSSTNPMKSRELAAEVSARTEVVEMDLRRVAISAALELRRSDRGLFRRRRIKLLDDARDIFAFLRGVK